MIYLLVIPDAAQRRSGTQRLCFAWLPGDAAHAMSPQLGQGVNIALLDARLIYADGGATRKVDLAQSQKPLGLHVPVEASVE